MTRKTNDQKILKMLNEGKPLQEIADHFQVSKTAIWKRKQRLLPPEEPESFKSLSLKEKKFALEIAEGRTQTDAAMASHDCTSRESGKAIGYQLMQKPDIQVAVSEIMQTEGLTKTYRVKKLKTHIDSCDPGISLKGLDQSWRLDGSYQDNIVVHPVIYVDLQKRYRELVLEERQLQRELNISDQDIIDEEEERLKQELNVNDNDILEGEVELIEETKG